MKKISAFLITLNEETRLARTLTAVGRAADEIIVVDSGSTDRTVEIARAHGATVYTRAFDGYGPQKRFAEDKCSNQYLLNLDADEVLSEGLITEILEFKINEARVEDGYRLRIRNVYPGEIRPRRFGYEYNEIRLYNRDIMRYRDHEIFDRVVPPDTAKIGQLKALVFHYPYVSFSQLAKKLDHHSAIQARYSPKPITIVVLRLPFEWLFQFIKFYFIRLHFLGGWAGLKFALLSAYYRWLRLVRMLAN